MHEMKTEVRNQWIKMPLFFFFGQFSPEQKEFRVFNSKSSTIISTIVSVLCICAPPTERFRLFVIPWSLAPWAIPLIDAKWEKRLLSRECDSYRTYGSATVPAIMPSWCFLGTVVLQYLVLGTNKNIQSKSYILHTVSYGMICTTVRIILLIYCMIHRARTKNSGVRAGTLG